MRKFQLQMIDGNELINFEWAPDQQAKAIVQIVHNIDEHMSMYQDIAKELNKHGILVFGTDLRGMGESSLESKEKGYFARHQGWNNSIEDLRTVNTYIRREYMDLPIFMLGQTIGTDFSLAYAIKYCETISGLILSGVKNHSYIKTLPKYIYLKTASILINKWPSNYFFKNLDGSFGNKRNPAMQNAWLSSDKEFVSRFNKDTLKLSWMTNCANKDILEGQVFLSKIKNIDMIDKDFPMLLMTGEQDAYTKFSKSTRRLFTKFIKLGNNVDFKIYKKSRNRIFSDKDKIYAIKDVLEFINKNLD
ncbi:alpha/beta fold hydrolase [Mesoplasma corruscae]|uniref:Lysophospholipase n=1 Tax=Mesoplasma corruscae TaxID=216874 RepID=A0A2S5RFT2_9MOLU|nr:alpha/beta fold hydrolase [Mesoplasma corruscae]PPE06196.1 lysophospholipase [Mesoplasma corruscae]